MAEETHLRHESELFEGLSDHEVSELLGLSSRHNTVKGQVIFNEGGEATRLYVVMQGLVELRKSIPVSKGTSVVTTVAACHPGDVFGWSALIQPHTYSSSAVALEPSDLLEFESRFLQDMLRASPLLGYKVMTCLANVVSRRLRQTTTALLHERGMSLTGPRF